MAETIDAHHHLWRYSADDYGWISPEMEVLRRDFVVRDLDRELRDAGIDGSVVVQARQSVEETRWLLEVAAEDEAIRGVVGWVPLASAELPGVLREFADCGKLKGVRHVVQDEPDDDFILGEDFNRGVAALVGTGLVYDILIHERHLPQAVRFVERHREQAFVLDHLAKPRIRDGILEPWRENLMRLAEHDNVSCKLSGLVTEADWGYWSLDDLRPYMDAALEAFGAERLMAGSDWPVCLVASDYGRWWETLREWAAGMREADREQIFGLTAKRVYRLG
ncbi:MAG TPA: amidohydrolase family protein [Acidobacteriaceae bacterium]|nr:amidohydrolase family protein [Acidobacteriaceae bacterium]